LISRYFQKLLLPQTQFLFPITPGLRIINIFS